ncbi:MAG: hypothetical protein V2J55_00140 [Candidatus Competibacteraceae bacterium]|jgi:hydroxymethylpyrimidine pyrophosphatase-like HAD family hydrolase|nr:hypothetical protein [Candidatus Competibacteraceae bacterium]
MNKSADRLQQAVYIFTDLDDSLFQTGRKCPEQTSLFAAAMDRHGQTLSYFTGAQKLLLTLFEQGTVIPVTGRNTTALERVHLRFTNYCVTSHGALILTPEGQPDTAWLIACQARYGDWAERMETASQQINQWIERSRLVLRCRVIEDHDLPVYVSIKGDESDLEQVACYASEIWQGEDVQVHRNGQNMALLPPFASKENAVEFLMRRFTETDAEPLFLGLGDSITDLPFLRLCHYAITPRDSQIQESWG